MDKNRLIERLMATFVAELEEHLRTLNDGVLALENESSPTGSSEIFETLFRAAHSLKGAARSVNQSEVEALCHRLEETFAQARKGRLALTRESFDALFAAIDAIRNAGLGLSQKKRPSSRSLLEAGAQLDLLAHGGRAPRAEGTALAYRPEDNDETAAPTRGGAEPLARVPVARLDSLVARCDELLIARRGMNERNADFVQLRERVRSWRRDWAKARSAAMAFVRSGAKAGNGAARAGGSATSSPLADRAASGLRQNAESLESLSRDLERLAAGVIANQKLLDQVAGPLEDEVRGIRMLPFFEACVGLDRMVRDIAKQEGKEAELVVEGGDIELDRAVIDGLRDPLIHLVRNAVSHGLEPCAARLQNGKPARGRITVTAALRHGRVEIVVADDGRGLDLDAIRERLHQKGFAIPAEDRDVIDAIFMPGITTAPIVTEVSGRGVGLDVVKTSIRSHRGTVSASFEPGLGTRFVLTVPLTLSLLRGLIVSSAGETFVLESAAVERLVRADIEDLRTVGGQEVVLIEGTPVPVRSLAELLGLPRTEAAEPGGKIPIVCVAAEGSRAGLAVDGLLAEQDVAVKPLSPRLAGLPYAAGATLLPTGRVALILNVAAVLAEASGRTSIARLSRAPEAAAQKKRLLVADDSVTTRTLEQTILESAGYEVMVAADGEDAWRLLQESGADLVVSDVDMPRMDGFALTETIRRSKRFREIPVVLVTALETESDKVRGLEVGADAYLLKSRFDQQGLLDTVARLL